MDILNITEKPEIDESIEKYEYHSYEPITGTDLNRPGEMRINIETQDLFTHPSESYLVFDGRLVKNAAYVNADVIALTNNAMMHLFNNIKHQFSGQEIECLFHPGQATTMLGLLKFPDDFQKSKGLNQLWFKDAGTAASIAEDNPNNGFLIRHGYIIQKPDPQGTFSFRVPLKHIFGFCDDYEKVIYGFKHQLTLVRKGDYDAIFRAAATNAGKIVLTKLSWYMPHVLPNDQEKLTLYKTIESKSSLPVGYQMVQCDSIPVPQTRNFTRRLSVKSARRNLAG